MLDGVTVEAHRIADQVEVLNLANATKRLIAMVRGGKFELTKSVFAEFNDLVAREDRRKSGQFRYEREDTNAILGGLFEPHERSGLRPKTSSDRELDRLFNEGVTALLARPPFERAVAFFLFGSLRRFFFEANQPSSKQMMDGVLMSNGIDAISVPAASSKVFREKMRRFYVSNDATEMLEILTCCRDR